MTRNFNKSMSRIIESMGFSSPIVRIDNEFNISPSFFSSYFFSYKCVSSFLIVFYFYDLFYILMLPYKYLLENIYIYSGPTCYAPNTLFTCCDTITNVVHFDICLIVFALIYVHVLRIPPK